MPRITAPPLPEITNLRVLTRADLAVLAEPRPPTRLKQLRDNHHRIARAVASGLKNWEVAEACGISVGRVDSLRKDPSFLELVAHYRGMLADEWASADPVVGYLRSNAAKAQAMLSDKLDEAAEKGEFLPTRDLLGIAELGLDRTGYGKVNKNVNVNVDFAANLEAARQRARSARSDPRLIEAEPSHDDRVVHSPNLAPVESPPVPSPASALNRMRRA